MSATSASATMKLSANQNESLKYKIHSAGPNHHSWRRLSPASLAMKSCWCWTAGSVEAAKEERSVAAEATKDVFLGLSCWVCMRALPRLQASDVCPHHAMWWMHQWQVQPSTVLVVGSPSLGGCFFQASSFFCRRRSPVGFLFLVICPDLDLEDAKEFLFDPFDLLLVNLPLVSSNYSLRDSISLVYLAWRARKF